MEAVPIRKRMKTTWVTAYGAWRCSNAGQFMEFDRMPMEYSDMRAGLDRDETYDTRPDLHQNGWQIPVS